LAATAESLYFSNMSVITVANATGTPAALTIGVAKDVSVSQGWEHAEAYGFASIRRVGVAKYNEKVTVKLGFIKFAPKLAEWFPFWIADGTAGSGTGLDNNLVTLFTVTELIVPMTTSGTVKLGRSVTGVYFPKFEIKAAEGQFVKVDLEGFGVTVVDSNPA